MYFSELSLEAQNVVLSVENTYPIFNKIQNLIQCLRKKYLKGEDLSCEYLAKSSVLEQICSLGVKELKKQYCELNIKSEHRKEFKKYYAEYIINEV